MVRMSSPKMEAIRFSEADVIVASSLFATTLTVSGLRDSTANNATFVTNNGHTYVNDGTMTKEEVFRAMSPNYEGGFTRTTTLQSTAGANVELWDLLGYDNAGRATNGNFEGSYTWNNSSNGFVRN